MGMFGHSNRQVCAMCNDARIVFDTEEGTYGRIGEPTEAALSVLVEKLGVPGTSTFALSFFYGSNALHVRKNYYLGLIVLCTPYVVHVVSLCLYLEA